MLLLFWLSLAFIVYTFAGYPALLWCLNRLRRHRRPPRRRAPITPSVSLIIVAHSAGKLIREKLENTLQLEYPENKLEVIVVSDGSNDDTVEVVRGFSPGRVKVIELQERKGKHYAQMIGRNASRGEILAFTDASVILEPASLRKMVENFADPFVGVVSSEDVVDGERHGAGEGSYVSGEMRLRRLESDAGSLVSVSGSFFGARREVCRNWRPERCSDFFIALEAIAAGYRTVTDPQCRAHFTVVKSGRAEFQRKLRTITQGLSVFFSYISLANPLRYGLFSMEFVSHKLFRWLLPYALAALLLSNILICKTHPLYLIFLLPQLAVYFGGLLGLALGSGIAVKPLRLASFFIISAAATIAAWVMLSLGEQYVVWEPSRRALGLGLELGIGVWGLDVGRDRDRHLGTSGMDSTSQYLHREPRNGCKVKCCKRHHCEL